MRLNKESQLLMPYKEKEINKLYYSISEIAAMFGENVSLIRFWEKEFDILKPKKNKKGNRMFTPKDIDNLKVIYHLVKERGYTLDGAKKKIKENKNDLDNQVQVIEKLQNIKAYLLDIKANL